MKRATPIWILLALMFSSSALASAPVQPVQSGFLPVPIVRQATYYSCGAGALLSLLYYWRVYDGSETALYPLLGTNEDQGTHPDAIVQVARAYGLYAELREHQTLQHLRTALNFGQTVILDIQAWPWEPLKQPWKDTWEEGHYVVLVGMDAHAIYVMDPSTSTSYGYIPIPEFLDRWHDYEVVNGQIRRYYQSAIYVSGKEPIRSFPAGLIRVE